MAKCPGCGSELPAAARFCPLCGRTVAPGSPPPLAAQTSAYAARDLADAPGPSGGDAGRRKIALASMIALALLAVGGVLFWQVRAGILSAQKPAAGPAVGILNAPPTQTVQAPVLSAPAPQAPSAPVLQAPRTTERPMPADVIAYLRWLKKFEAARRSLEYQGMAELTVFTQKATTGAIEGLMNADPTGEPAPARPEDNPVVGIGKVIQQWNAATAQFMKVPPPDPCANLATNYGQALTAGVQQMSAIHGILTNALASIRGSGGQATDASKDALGELYRQKSSRSGSVSVDQAYANANAALDAVRSQYTSLPDDINRQNFDIKSGGGSVNLPFGLGM